MASSQFVSASSLAWVVGRDSLKFGVRCGSLKFGVGLISLWVSQVHRDSPKLGGVGWGFESVWIVVSRFVLALGPRIMVDRRECFYKL